MTFKGFMENTLKYRERYILREKLKFGYSNWVQTSIFYIFKKILFFEFTLAVFFCRSAPGQSKSFGNFPRDSAFF